MLFNAADLIDILNTELGFDAFLATQQGATVTVTAIGVGTFEHLLAVIDVYDINYSNPVFHTVAIIVEAA